MYECKIKEIQNRPNDFRSMRWNCRISRVGSDYCQNYICYPDFPRLGQPGTALLHIGTRHAGMITEFV